MRYSRLVVIILPKIYTEIHIRIIVDVFVSFSQMFCIAL